LEAKPLPVEGQLPGFNGAFGNLSLDAPQLSTNVVRVGEAVRLTIIIRARAGTPANLTRLVPPAPPKSELWQVLEAVPSGLPPQILQAQGFTAVFYLVAGLVGKASRWIVPERGIEFSLMDWTAACQLEAAGFQCGSHTMNHPRLADLSPLACRNELLQSRRLLEDRLGHEVRHLAYQFGSFNDSVRALAAETGYHSACSVNIGLSPPDDDLLALHRVPVNGQDSLPDFVCRLYTAQRLSEVLYGKAQNAWRRLWRPRVSAA